MPKVIIDRVGDIYVTQSNAAWADRYFATSYEALEAVVPLKTMIKTHPAEHVKLKG